MSHVIFRCACQLVNEFTGALGRKEVGRLLMVDMAGSESMANATPAMLVESRKQETKTINQSLLTFGRVLIDLTRGSSYIPYRDSKLTRLVSEALGGMCRTTIVATGVPLCFHTTSCPHRHLCVRVSRLQFPLLGRARRKRVAVSHTVRWPDGLSTSHRAAS